MALPSLFGSPGPNSVLTRFRKFVEPTVRYLFTIESHVYAMAISGSVLFAFFPFMVLILSLTRNVFEWKEATDAIFLWLEDTLPQDPGLVGFVKRNLNAAVISRGRVEAVSIVLLIFSSQGIFMPLEVALNRLWGFAGDRSYWWNQLISFGLAAVCGLLALIGAAVTSVNVGYLERLFVDRPDVLTMFEPLVVKAAAIPFSVLLVLLVYWLLPNGKIPARSVLPASILVGIALEVVKNLYLWLWPLLDFRQAYGPFFISVTLLLWAFLAAMILLAGAEIAARNRPKATQ